MTYSSPENPEFRLAGQRSSPSSDSKNKRRKDEECGMYPEDMVSLISDDSTETNDDSDEGKVVNNDHSSSSTCSRLSHAWNRPWIPDGPWEIQRGDTQEVTRILDATAVKLLKFAMVTFSLIFCLHYGADSLNINRDEDYNLREMILFDGNHVILDMMVFFMVGRLYRNASVDSLAFVVPVIVTAVVQGCAAKIAFLNHSITAYEIHCVWGWQMWSLIILVALPILSLLIGSHIAYAFYDDGGRYGIQKLIEMGVAVLVFVVPYFGDPSFHMHHWYYGWMIGMHANNNTWWSRCMMACFWGFYVNGIALFGRDPIMTCAVSLYQSQNQGCPYSEDITSLDEVLSQSLGFQDCAAGPP